MRVALIVPPSPFLIDQKAFSPLGMMALAAFLRAKDGHEVSIHDLAGRESELEAALEGVDAQVVGVTATSPQYPLAAHIASILQNRKPAPVLVTGGVHPTTAPETCLEDPWDHIVLGEGEQAMAALLSALERGEKPPRRLQHGHLEDLDTLPFPAYDLVNLDAYGYAIEGRRAQTLMTSRGCPCQCSFCSKGVWKKTGVRFHSPQYVESLAAHLATERGYRDLLFLDDSLTRNRDRILDICRRIEPLGLRFRCYADVRSCTLDVLRALRRVGCIEIGAGIESGSQRVLDLVDKGSTVEENTAFIERCRKVGIASNAFIMIGLPGESRETVAETREWMERARPDKFGYNIFMPYAGTPVHRKPERYGVRILPMPLEDTWVKGRQGEYNAFVETEALSRDEILELFTENFAYFRELTGWQPGHNTQEHPSHKT